LDQLLDHFRRTSSRTSLAVDERGAITGWVQIEDVVEELVTLAQEDESLGFDEVQLVGLSTWQVPGRLTIHEWRDLFPSALPSMPRVSTIAGLITSTLGRIPEPGDHVDVGNVRLTVDSMAGRVIEHVRVTLIDPSESEGGEP
ncbi:MAG: transporter associated domain-containing protein, partial [Planctomycetota bacterium]